MRVKFEGNVLTINTGVTKEIMEAGYTNLVAKDDKGNQVYRLAMAKDGEGKFDAHGMTCNAYIDGSAAVVVVLPTNADIEGVKKAFGADLVAASKYIPQIVTEAASAEQAIDAVFAE